MWCSQPSTAPEDFQTGMRPTQGPSNLTLRLAHSSIQACAMRFSFDSKTALSEDLPDRSSQPVVLVEALAVGKPWAARPCHMSSGFRTRALAIVTVEHVDGTPADFGQTHVVLRYLAGEGHRMLIENGDCMYETAVSEARGVRRGCSRCWQARCLSCL